MGALGRHRGVLRGVRLCPSAGAALGIELVLRVEPPASETCAYRPRMPRSASDTLSSGLTQRRKTDAVPANIGRLSSRHALVAARAVHVERVEQTQGPDALRRREFGRGGALDR